MNPGAFVRPRGAFTSDSAYNAQLSEAASPESRVDELLAAMTEPQRERMIEAQEAARCRRIVLEHGPIPPLEFSNPRTTLGEILDVIGGIEADQSIRVENVLREPTTGRRIGIAFRLEHRS
jgi:hypothetical protein